MEYYKYNFLPNILKHVISLYNYFIWSFSY